MSDEKLSERLWGFLVEHNYAFIKDVDFTKFLEDIKSLEAENQRLKEQIRESLEDIKTLQFNLATWMAATRDAESRLAEAENILSAKEEEFTKSHQLHEEKFTVSVPNSHESRMEYYEMGRATGVLNMVKWLEKALRGGDGK